MTDLINFVYREIASFYLGKSLRGEIPPEKMKVFSYGQNRQNP